MTAVALPEPYATIDAQLEAGDFDGAKTALETAAGDADIAELLRVKLAVLSGTMAAPQAMPRVVALLRKNSKLAGGTEFYRKLSAAAYDSGRSSMSHSHPPRDERNKPRKS